ncbi:MarR family transcriptional regulator [candidate division KSB1 bacterium]|nr:MarR family transcriptional regulator [candidate division KSB1 bacterium]
MTMHRQTNAHLAPFGVTADQFVCLVSLSENDGITQQELVALAASDPNTIRAMLVLLEKNGLVSRDQHPTDGRARSVSMTPEGRRLFEKMVKAVEPVQQRLISLFTDEQIVNLCDYLKGITQSMT